MRPLTVMQIVPELKGGGVERGTLEIAQALIAAGHRSWVVSAGGGMVAELEAQGSRHHCLPVAHKSLRSLRAIRPLRRFIREVRPDIIHWRSRLPAWLTHFALRGLAAHERPHVVSTVHGLYSVNRYSRIMVRAEAVIAVSQTVTDYIRQNYPDIPDERITQIYRGIDPAAFPLNFQPEESWLAAWRAQYPQLHGKRVLTLPGRITRLKGHHDFIVLLAKLLAAGEPVMGLIVGGEDPRRAAYAAELREALQVAGLSEHVIFTGARRDIREIYAVSDVIFSLSTKPESFGRTVLEALAMGRPVIGYAHGGVGEILSRLFPEGAVTLADTEALVRKTQELLAAPRRPRTDNPFLLASMTEQTLALYSRLAEPSP